MGSRTATADWRERACHSQFAGPNRFGLEHNYILVEAPSYRARKAGHPLRRAISIAGFCSENGYVSVQLTGVIVDLYLG
jgi:hypothetical protein